MARNDQNHKAGAGAAPRTEGTISLKKEEAPKQSFSDKPDVEPEYELKMATDGQLIFHWEEKNGLDLPDELLCEYTSRTAAQDALDTYFSNKKVANA